jgi:hypothetical protein
MASFLFGSLMSDGVLGGDQVLKPWRIIMACSRGFTIWSINTLPVSVTRTYSLCCNFFGRFMRQIRNTRPPGNFPIIFRVQVPVHIMQLWLILIPIYISFTS